MQCAGHVWKHYRGWWASTNPTLQLCMENWPRSFLDYGTLTPQFGGGHMRWQSIDLGWHMPLCASPCEHATDNESIKKLCIGCTMLTSHVDHSQVTAGFCYFRFNFDHIGIWNPRTFYTDFPEKTQELSELADWLLFRFLRLCLWTRSYLNLAWPAERDY